MTVDVQPGKPKHANDIKVEEILAASMPNLVVATPDGQFPIRNASMKEEEKAEAYTIPANDDMGETIVIKMTGQASGATGELQMVLKGPPSGATSKIIYNSNIYWSNCQFVP